MIARKRAALYGAAAAVVVAASGTAGYYLQRDGGVAVLGDDARIAERDATSVAADADHDADDLVRQADPIYYTFTAPFTVNVKEDDAVIEATVAVSSHYATTIENVKADEPALRAQVILALSDATEAAASTDAGKVALQQRVAALLNRQLRADGYAATLDAAYFSDFVIQGNDDG